MQQSLRIQLQNVFGGLALNFIPHTVVDHSHRLFSATLVLLREACPRCSLARTFPGNMLGFTAASFSATRRVVELATSTAKAAALSRLV
eukprot:3004425-Amphidinium_carterae.1